MKDANDLKAHRLLLAVRILFIYSSNFVEEEKKKTTKKVREKERHRFDTRENGIQIIIQINNNNSNVLMLTTLI